MASYSQKHTCDTETEINPISFLTYCLITFHLQLQLIQFWYHLTCFNKRINLSYFDISLITGSKVIYYNITSYLKNDHRYATK